MIGAEIWILSMVDVENRAVVVDNERVASISMAGRAGTVRVSLRA